MSSPNPDLGQASRDLIRQQKEAAQQIRQMTLKEIAKQKNLMQQVLDTGRKSVAEQLAATQTAREEANEAVRDAKTQKADDMQDVLDRDVTEIYEGAQSILDSAIEAFAEDGDFVQSMEKVRSEIEQAMQKLEREIEKNASSQPPNESQS
jgi:uncharacterized phage infection (PIP) family protein YhgE